MFLYFLKYINESSEEDFKYIIANQQELFGRDDVILEWIRLKNMIKKNNELSKRYKTLDGKTCDKIKDLNENTLFNHVNISANTCITRIASIMNKFYMNEDDVKIKLKN